MAVSLEASNKTWQKVRAAFDTLGATPADRAAFKALKEYLATYKGNPDLQLFQFSEADCDAAGGTVLLTGACTVFGVFVKKVSAATDNYFKVYDDATDDTTAGDQIIAIPLLNTTQYGTQIASDGLPFATGIVVTQHTTSIGTTDGSDGGNGFILVGA
jgi:hypothetical protein